MRKVSVRSFIHPKSLWNADPKQSTGLTTSGANVGNQAYLDENRHALFPPRPLHILLIAQLFDEAGYTLERHFNSVDGSCVRTAHIALSTLPKCVSRDNRNFFFE